MRYLSGALAQALLMEALGVATKIQAVSTSVVSGLDGITTEQVFYRDTSSPLEMAEPAITADEATDDETMQQEGTGDNDYVPRPMPIVLPDDASIGDEVAWLAVQMACGTDDQDESLFAPDANPWAQIDNPRLANEFAIMDATLGTYGGNNAYASCTQAACGVIAAVVDMDAITQASGCPMDMYEYLPQHPEIYQPIEAETLADLRPGDILACDHHTSIYVGNEMAQTKFPGTGNCVYQASYQSGRSAKYPELNGLSDGDLHWSKIYRPIARNLSCGYDYIDYRGIVTDIARRQSE